MVVNERPLKRMRTRVADLNDFLKFPTDSNEFSGPFRSNIRSFLTKHAHLPSPSSLFPSLLVWLIFFRIGEVDGDSASLSPPPEIVTLDVIEEDVARSRSIYCDQCRVIGWSGHPVCGKRYHFIIRRNNAASEDAYKKWCTNCGCVLLMDVFRCKSCNYELTAADLQDWVNLQLENTTHLLHGVVHSNGYGHLLRVNGREGGSKSLSGCDIMNFWDRLCRILRARKISVMDVSKKYGLEFRLLHAITNDHIWYGEWGYEFGAGSFALTHGTYRKAVDTLSEIPLSRLFQARKPRTRLHDLIIFYQGLSESQLQTIRELFCFLTGLIHKTKWSQVASKSSKIGSSSMELSTSTIDDIERVQQSMIKVLQVTGETHWVSWRALKGVTFNLATPDLLKYCLNTLDGKVLDNGRVVLSRCNPESDAIEYRLAPSSSGSDTSRPQAALIESTKFPSKEHLLRHLKFLYDALLNPYTMLSYRPKAIREQAVSAAMKLIDCKQFVKDYESVTVAGTNPFILKFSCTVKLTDLPSNYTCTPPELVFLPLKATIADLKTEATKALQDVYILFQKFEVEELLGYDEVEEASEVKFLIGTSGSIEVKGRFHQVEGLEHFRMERGLESWTVRCKCGAKDDDGERMLACDACGLWQHTRCVGIDDLDPVPESFSCNRCTATKKSTKSSKNTKKLICGSNGGGKTKERTLTLSKTCTDYENEILDAEQIFALEYLKFESPTQSGTSGIFDDVQYQIMGPPSFEKHEKLGNDTFSCKTESPNLSSTTSDETSVSDTCSSKIGFACKYDAEAVTALDTFRVGNGFTNPLSYAADHKIV